MIAVFDGTLGTLRLTGKNLLLANYWCFLAIVATCATKAYCCIPAVILTAVYATTCPCCIFVAIVNYG
jgi:hypothetical protein